MELKREKKKLLSESNLRLLTSLTISLANKVDSTAEKCINPFTPNTPYAKGAYVTHDNYIYESKLACNDADWVESHWIRLSDTIEELTVDDVKSWLSLTQDQLDTLSKIILDSEVRLDKTWSSSRVYSSIQDAIDTSKAYTLAELGKASGASYRVVASTAEMTEQKYIYLMSDGSGSYNMYIVEDNGSATQIGNTTISLDDYFTKQEITDSYYDKSTSDGKFATITTVDTHIADTDVHTTATEKASYALKTEVLSADNIKTLADEQISKNQKNQLKDYYVKLTSNTDMSDFGIDDLSTLTSLLDLTKVLGYHVRFTIQVNLGVTNILYNSNIIPVEKAGLLILTCEYARGSAIYHTYDNMIYATSTDNSTTIEWRTWSKSIDDSNLTTTIGKTSTNNTVPTSKAIYDNYGVKTFTSLSQIGLTEGSETLEDIAKNLPEFSILNYIVASTSNAGEYPYKDGMLIVNKMNDFRVKFIFYKDQLGTPYEAQYHKSSGVTPWQRVCTTSVADVGITGISSSNSNVTLGSNSCYSVVNGICYVTIWDFKGLATGIGLVVSTGMPKTKQLVGTSIIGANNGGGNIGFISVSNDSKLYAHVYTANVMGYCSFSYPVAES